MVPNGSAAVYTPPEASSSQATRAFLFATAAGGFVMPTPLHEPSCPLAATVLLDTDPAKGCPCPVHQQCAEIAIASFTDPQQAGPATGGVLPRDQPVPRRKLPAILQMPHITDGSHQGGGRQRPNSWDRQQALTDGMGDSEGFQLLGIRRQPFLQGTQLVIELREKFLAHRGHLAPLRFECGEKGLPEFVDPLREYDPILT